MEAVADRPERTFSYRLPAQLEPAAPGSLLLVPYGRRLALGYLMPGTADGDADLKAVEAVVSEPMLTADLLALAEELSVYYRAPLGTTLAAMLPPGLESRLERRWQILDEGAVPGLAGTVRETVLRRMAPRGDGQRWVEGLRRAGAIRPLWSLRAPDQRPRMVRILRRLGAGEPARGASRQRALLAVLGDGERSIPELASDLGVEASTLLGPARRLAQHGLVEIAERAVERDPLAHRQRQPPLLHALADEQGAALAAISQLAPGGELLLEGVAASGKSDVYLAALAAELQAGRGSIVLVPEISLVPQLADRVAALVGDELAVFHSGLSAGERHDQWWRILRGEARVVVGTRMAVFAPVEALGLIVVDEEHDGGYKSDRTPRYDARWVARRRAALAGARLVLGSATPDLVTLAAVRGGHAERAILAERRVGSAPRRRAGRHARRARGG